MKNYPLDNPYSAYQIAKKYKVKVSEAKNQLVAGMNVEFEHTKDKKTATTIASHHIYKDGLLYYDKSKGLPAMEKNIKSIKPRKLKRGGNITTDENIKNAVNEYLNSEKSLNETAKEFGLSWFSLRSYVIKINGSINKNEIVLSNNPKIDYTQNEKEWRDVVGYEGLYIVSRDGIVRRVETKVKSKYFFKTVHATQNKTFVNEDGYIVIYLSKNGRTRTHQLHRIIAQSFIPNPKNNPQINHINGIKTDNRIENLEWCTAQENIIHSYKVLGKIHNCTGILNRGGKKINQFDLEGNFIKQWDSIMDVERQLGIKNTNVSACCAGKERVDSRGNKHIVRTAGGFKWEYENKEDMRYRNDPSENTGKLNNGGNITNDGRRGGLFYGKSHKEGGIQAVVVDAGNKNIETETLEPLIAAESANCKTCVHTLNGKTLTNKQILSELNQAYGGVAIAKEGAEIGKDGTLISNIGGKPISVESGQVVIKAAAYESTDLHDFDGKKMKVGEIVSLINQEGGGDPIPVMGDGGGVKDVKSKALDICGKYGKCDVAKDSTKEKGGGVNENTGRLADSNSYYKVIAPFPVFVMTGYKPSNSYYASSQIQQPVYQEYTVKVGDEIQNLHGGLFLATKHKMPFHVDDTVVVNKHIEEIELYPIKTEVMEFAPFEKKYGRDHQLFDLSKMELKQEKKGEGGKVESEFMRFWLGQSDKQIIGFLLEMGEEELLDTVVEREKTYSIDKSNIVDIIGVVYQTGKSRKDLINIVRELDEEAKPLRKASNTEPEEPESCENESKCMDKGGEIKIKFDKKELTVDVFNKKGDHVGFIKFQAESESDYVIVDAKVFEEHRRNHYYTNAILQFLKENPQITIYSSFRSHDANFAWSYLIDHLPAGYKYDKKMYPVENTVVLQLNYSPVPQKMAGGEVSDQEKITVEEIDGKIIFEYSHNDINFSGYLSSYNTGRETDYKVETDWFADAESEKYWDDEWETLSEKIINKYADINNINILNNPK